jgi:BolA family transcriptional regulator, general stress-responsive regulator
MSRQSRIRAKIEEALAPMHLEIVDESHMHSVPPGAKSHFRVMVVSERFTSQGLVARHRDLHRLLRDELDSGLHALALHTWTPEEWFAKGGAAPESPPCLGGSKV